jgi:hypothetical protein
MLSSAMLRIPGLEWCESRRTQGWIVWRAGRCHSRSPEPQRRWMSSREVSIPRLFSRIGATTTHRNPAPNAGERHVKINAREKTRIPSTASSATPHSKGECVKPVTTWSLKPSFRPHPRARVSNAKTVPGLPSIKSTHSGPCCSGNIRRGFDAETAPYSFKMSQQPRFITEASIWPLCSP